MKFMNYMLDASSFCGAPTFKCGIEVTAALAVAASVVGAWSSSYAAERANSTNREIAHEANEENWKMLQEQERYNSPENQAKMFEQAGFSKYAMLGNSSSVGLGSSAQSAAANVPNLGSFDQMASMLFNYQNLSADTAEKRANVLKTDAETFNLSAQNKFIHEQQQIELLKNIEQFKGMGLNNIAKGLENKFNQDSFQERLQSQVLNNELARNQINKIVADTNLVTLNTMIANKEYSWIDKIKSSELQYNLARMGTEFAMQNNYGKQAELAVQQTLESAARTSGQKISNQQAANASQYIVQQMKHNATQAEFDALLSGTNFLYRSKELENYDTDKWFKRGNLIINGATGAVVGYAAGKGKVKLKGSGKTINYNGSTTTTW